MGWTKDLIKNSITIMICGKVQHISVSKEFSTKSVNERYDLDSFTFHLMAMKNPDTGERIKGGIGKIELVEETEL